MKSESAIADERKFYDLIREEQKILALVRDINETGYAVLPDVVSYTDLEDVRKIVRHNITSGYPILIGSEPVAGTVLERMATSPLLRSICTRMYQIETGSAPPDQPYFQVLRCLSGNVGRSTKHSLKFHFDSYVVTLILPIEIQHGKDNGEFIMLPNVRGIRRSYARNLMDKLWLDLPARQAILRRRWKRHPERFVRIAFVPGNLYFLWGYRSIHTNAPCDPDKIRATALFHYGNPHSDSKLRRLIRRAEP